MDAIKLEAMIFYDLKWSERRYGGVVTDMKYWRK